MRDCCQQLLSTLQGSVRAAVVSTLQVAIARASAAGWLHALRNLDLVLGLLNGTKLRISRLGLRVIEAEWL